RSTPGPAGPIAGQLGVVKDEGDDPRGGEGRTHAPADPAHPQTPAAGGRQAADPVAYRSPATGRAEPVGNQPCLAGGAIGGGLWRGRRARRAYRLVGRG